MTQNKKIPAEQSTDQAIGSALKDLRLKFGFSARQLAETSGVSAAMISRIENGQVSPSISTLDALASALQVPMVSLFRETSNAYSDFTFVKAGEGLKSTRIVNEHTHNYIDLCLHTRRDVQFGARIVTLTKQDASPPLYIGHGVVFIYIIEGSAIYRYGSHEIELNPGDSLSIDAELKYGFVRLLTHELIFLTAQSESTS